MTGWDARPRDPGVVEWEIPPPSRWPQHDVIAAGADLAPATIVAAYRAGAFPMPGPDGQLLWWSPMRRGVVPLDGLRVTRSMRRSARRYEVRVDTCFDMVARGCAAPHREGGWITPEFLEAYDRLHRLGWAHSFEAFDEHGLLAGGLYGVRVGGLFAGESMFHILRDASKVALMALVDAMRESGMRLLDVQWVTPHLASLGAVEIPREEYLRRLADALEVGLVA